ncbi:unnamed protein product [Fusarium graminearum]|nr:unnamed protein product [Fusarium graminearum]
MSSSEGTYQLLGRLANNGLTWVLSLHSFNLQPFDEGQSHVLLWGGWPNALPLCSGRKGHQPRAITCGSYRHATFPTVHHCCRNARGAAHLFYVQPAILHGRLLLNYARRKRRETKMQQRCKRKWRLRDLNPRPFASIRDNAKRT